MKYFFTSDWHVGEAQTPNTHSFLRPRPTDVMAEEWLADLKSKITPEDTLVFVGDLGIQLSDVNFFKRLPECRKILILGDKEYASKNFTEDEITKYVIHEKIFDETYYRYRLKIQGIDFVIAHKPSDCFGQGLPAICGHVHGIWRSAEMPKDLEPDVVSHDKLPIINVGIDVWGGLVSEEFIIHQYNAITKYYDDEAFPNRWK